MKNTKKVINNPKAKNPPLTKSALKQAYQIVTQDLFNSLVKAKTEQTVHIGPLGSFSSLKKTEDTRKTRAIEENQIRSS